MPLTPGEVRKRRSERDAERVADICKTVDETLVNETESLVGVRVDGSVPETIINTVADTYRRLGWEVDFGREGRVWIITLHPVDDVDPTGPDRSSSGSIRHEVFKEIQASGVAPGILLEAARIWTRICDHFSEIKRPVTSWTHDVDGDKFKLQWGGKGVNHLSIVVTESRSVWHWKHPNGGQGDEFKHDEPLGPWLWAAIQDHCAP